MYERNDRERESERVRALSNEKNQQRIIAFFISLFFSFSVSLSLASVLCQHSFALHESVCAYVCLCVYFSLTRTQCDLHSFSVYFHWLFFFLVGWFYFRWIFMYATFCHVSFSHAIFTVNALWLYFMVSHKVTTKCRLFVEKNRCLFAKCKVEMWQIYANAHT